MDTDAKFSNKILPNWIQSSLKRMIIIIKIQVMQIILTSQQSNPLYP